MVVLAAIGKHERSKHVVEIANDLASTYDDELVAVHVVPREAYEEHKAAIQDIDGFRDFSIDREAESAEEFARRFVDDAAGDVDVELRTMGRVGDIADEVLDVADSLDPRYLVISGRRRSPVGKAVFGNTTQKILLNAQCPVVTKLSE